MAGHSSYAFKMLAHMLIMPVTPQYGLPDILGVMFHFTDSLDFLTHRIYHEKRIELKVYKDIVQNYGISVTPGIPSHPQ